MSLGDNFTAPTGKRRKADGAVVDIASMIEALHKALVTDKNAGVLLYDANGAPLLTAANPGSVKVVNADAEAIPTKLTGSITEVASTVTVGVVTGLALAANANRKYASFQNISDTAIFLTINSSAALNQGIMLNPNGGTYEMSIAAGNLDIRAVNAISAAASKALLVREGV